MASSSNVHAAIRRFFAGLERPVTGVLAGVSGGADSAAMLFALSDLRGDFGFAVHAGYLNHGQRPEADREIALLQMLCDELDVPFHVGRANVPEVARNEKVSLEVAGRLSRYRFLYATAADHGLDAVATAHTRDDQAETVLLRVLMGTGLDGLGGIAPVREAVPPEAPRPTLLLRPVLKASRQDAEDLCRRRGWTPFQDPCNRDLSYPRNRLRHEVLPLLERCLNPNVREALTRLADIAREDDQVLAALVEDIAVTSPGGGVEAPVASLMGLPLGLRRRAARKLLARAGARGKTLGFESVERLLSTAAGGSADLGSGIRCESDGERVVLLRPAARQIAGPYEVEVVVPGITQLPVGTLHAETGAAPPAEIPWQAALDWDRLPQRLVARTRRPGDRIRLAGGTKKLGDLMTDRKVPADLRERLPVVTSPEEVVWVPGLAVSRDYAARGGGTALRLTFSPARPEDPAAERLDNKM